MSKFHNDGTMPNKSTDVFVFGSNLAGIHGAGAAKVANEVYGRPYGFDTAIGVYDNHGKISYAVPTKSVTLTVLPLAIIRHYVESLILYIKHHPESEFFITRIGCGFAGYNDSDIAPMFKALTEYSNVSFAKEWEQYVI